MPQHAQEGEEDIAGLSCAPASVVVRNRDKRIDSSVSFGAKSIDSSVSRRDNRIDSSVSFGAKSMDSSVSCGDIVFCSDISALIAVSRLGLNALMAVSRSGITPLVSVSRWEINA